MYVKAKKIMNLTGFKKHHLRLLEVKGVIKTTRDSSGYRLFNVYDFKDIIFKNISDKLFNREFQDLIQQKRSKK